MGRTVRLHGTILPKGANRGVASGHAPLRVCCSATPWGLMPAVLETPRPGLMGSPGVSS